MGWEIAFCYETKFKSIPNPVRAHLQVRLESKANPRRICHLLSRMNLQQMTEMLSPLSNLYASSRSFRLADCAF